jgi:hypothetical protein
MAHSVSNGECNGVNGINGISGIKGINGTNGHVDGPHQNSNGLNGHTNGYAYHIILLQ